jgi:hypothetical protein
MEERAVCPDDAAVMGLVMLDLEVVAMMVYGVRREVAVGDGVIVRVSGLGLMDMLRRQRRRERQERRDHQHGSRPGDVANHSVHY